jgi:hypothetical protein
MIRGYSLLELILALFLFQVGMLAAAGLVHLSQVNLRRAELTVRAILEAEWVGDSILSLGSMTPGVATYPWGDLSWSVLSSPIPALRIAAWAEIEGDTLFTLLALPPLPTGPPIIPADPPPPEVD